MSEPAEHRVGKPSPLIFHLNAALQSLYQATLAAPRATSPDFPWADGLAAIAAKWPGPPDQAAVATEAVSRLQQTLSGIRTWQAHPYRRQVKEPKTVWQSGSTRLLDYGNGSAGAPPVLVVPSLINRAYILDLHPASSMLRRIASQGLRPFLLDWGVPGPPEAGFSLCDYGIARMLPSLAFIHGMTGRDVGLLGYCMGGTLAAAFTSGRPAGVAALATLGAPYSFSDARGAAGQLRQAARNMGTGAIRRVLEAQAQAFGYIPSEFFQYLFAVLNPAQAGLKFRRFAALDPAGRKARHFAALEDWLADDTPMSLAAAADVLIDWQLDDALVGNTWHFMGGAVDMAQVAVPTLVITGRRDHIAPPVSSQPLARAIPGARHLQIDCGHVGMIVGGKAHKNVWQPLAKFLLKHAG